MPLLCFTFEEVRMVFTNTSPLIWVFITAIFGGLIGSTVTVLSARSLAKKERIHGRLYSQITLLYGPIYYRILQNKVLFELNKKFHEAYDKEIDRKDWSQESDIQKSVGEMADLTISLANNYIDEVVANNEKIKTCLDENFSLCDSEDTEAFTLFYEHYIRFKKEVDSSGKTKTPHMVYKIVGDISFMRPEFSTPAL